MAADGDFQWVDDTRVSNLQWAEGFPVDGNNCVGMARENDKQWVWRNELCSNYAWFLCEDKGNATNVLIIKYKDNRPSSCNLKSLVHKHKKPGINVTIKTTRTLGKTLVCE